MWPISPRGSLRMWPISPRTPSALRRARDEQWAAEAVIWSGCAKLILWLETWHWARVGVYPDAVRVEVALGGIRQTLTEIPAETGSGVTLAIRATRAAAQAGRISSPPDRLAFGLMEGSMFRSLAALDGRYFSTEVAGGFTGRVIGIGAAAGGAMIARFAYAPLHHNKPPSDPATACKALFPPQEPGIQTDGRASWKKGGEHCQAPTPGEIPGSIIRWQQSAKVLRRSLVDHCLSGLQVKDEPSYPVPQVVAIGRSASCLSGRCSRRSGDTRSASSQFRTAAAASSAP